MNDLNTIYFALTRIWNSEKNGTTVAKRDPDCSYGISYLGLYISPFNNDYRYIKYIFKVSQLKCITTIENVLGGATFMLTAFNDDSLGVCKYNDFNDGTYGVICTFRMLNLVNSKNAASQLCMNMTILVDYEHFDGYSDGLPGLTSKLYKGYNELRYNILDNQQFCSRQLDNGRQEIYNQLNPKFQAFLDLEEADHGEILPDRTRLITGEWLSSSAKNKLSYLPSTRYSSNKESTSNGKETKPIVYVDDKCYSYPNHTLFSGFDHRRETNQISRLTYGNFTDDLSFPEIVRSDRSQAISDLYNNFHPIIIQSNNSPKYFQRVSEMSPYDDSMAYHFIGASHMRYIFDAIIEHFLSEESLKDLKPHHGDVTIHNLRNYHSVFDFSSALSDDQADMLANLCSSFANPYGEGANMAVRNHTIIFQTGAWDLTNSPIRRFFRDENCGVKLLKSINRILTNPTRHCPNLRHFVWVTTVPHPICFNDDEPFCQENKGYRTNSAISALIQYYHQELMSIRPHDQVLLSIVDSYSFILPRLLLHPDSESICLSHYHCRVKLYEETPEKAKLVMAHTPSGIGMVQAVLSALS